MLEVKNASLRLEDKTLFENLSFMVDEGETACIVGESGAGKSTLLRAIMGLQPLDEGLISIDGELLTPASAEAFRRFMAYVPQDLSMPVEWVRDMVKMPFALKANASKTFSKDRLIGEMHKLGLDAKLYDHRVSELSGGERQRMMLAVCGLLAKPIILADEPTSALDPSSAVQVLTYLKSLAEGGAIVVAVSHDKTFAQGCAKTIVL